MSYWERGFATGMVAGLGLSLGIFLVGVWLT